MKLEKLKTDNQKRTAILLATSLGVATLDIMYLLLGANYSDLKQVTWILLLGVYFTANYLLVTNKKTAAAIAERKGTATIAILIIIILLGSVRAMATAWIKANNAQVRTEEIQAQPSAAPNHAVEEINYFLTYGIGSIQDNAKVERIIESGKLPAAKIARSLNEYLKIAPSSDSNYACVFTLRAAINKATKLTTTTLVSDGKEVALVSRFWHISPSSSKEITEGQVICSQDLYGISQDIHDPRKLDLEILGLTTIQEEVNFELHNDTWVAEKGAPH